MTAFDRETGDVPVFGSDFWVVFHFGKYVSDDGSVEVFGDPEELGPGEEVVEVVFHLVVFGEAPEVCHLHH